MSGRGISTIKSKLIAIAEDRYRGAILQACAETFLFGEQPKKHALTSEKKCAISKEINCIQNGPNLTSEKAVRIKTFVKHYTARVWRYWHRVSS